MSLTPLCSGVILPRPSKMRGIAVYVLIIIAFTSFLTEQVMARERFTPEDLLKIKKVAETQISPDGKWIAYTVNIMREPDDEPGPNYDELWVVSTETGESRPFITGKVDITKIDWHPDGQFISFLAERGSKIAQVWMIPLGGGEARQVTRSESDITWYRWHPSGKMLGYLATTPKTSREKALEKAGYDFIYFEEELKHRNLYLVELDEMGNAGAPRQLTDGVTVWDFEFSPDLSSIAAAISPRNLIDHRYVFRKIYLLDVNGSPPRLFVDNPGKLGNYVFSPDGKHLAYAAALSQKDHAVSQAYVAALASGEIKNLTPPNFRGHVEWVGWKDNRTLFYRAGEGVETTLNAVNIHGGGREVVLSSANEGVVFKEISTFGSPVQALAFTGESPIHPGEVFYTARAEKKARLRPVKRLTDLNPWLSHRTFGKQEAIRYSARDGQEVEGLLIYPPDYEAGKTYPLVVIVHGGPESHWSNGWLSSYSRPGQVLANQGYVVFYPNYGASTGYGVEFAARGYNDAAGKEFDDIADGIDYLIAQGLADPQRVGLGGGSYGGFASAWFASYYTEKVRAVCMFVGISDLISKRGTTDIPYEELFVHSGKKLEEMWEQSLTRSPIYHAHKSKTAVLIYGGTADTRVHPSQSLEFYRRLKMNDHPAVRLVQYPGEPHGNRKQTGQIDVLYRILDWYNWYVKDLKPLDGPLPPLDISDKYGIPLTPSPVTNAPAVGQNTRKAMGEK